MTFLSLYMEPYIKILGLTDSQHAQIVDLIDRYQNSFFKFDVFCKKPEYDLVVYDHFCKNVFLALGIINPIGGWAIPEPYKCTVVLDTLKIWYLRTNVLTLRAYDFTACLAQTGALPTNYHGINNEIFKPLFDSPKGVLEVCKEHWENKHVIDSFKCSLYCLLSDWNFLNNFVTMAMKHNIKLPGKEPKAPAPKTQKIRGLVELSKHAQLHTYFRVLDFKPITSQQYLDWYVEANHIEKKFARPCPITPQHGFVDSCVVNSSQELVTVWEKAREADPHAELLICPFIDAQYNMIWANGKLTIGPSHDGATSGKDSIVFPTINLDPFKSYYHKWESIKESPFFEMVKGKDDRITITQLRDGPAIQGGEDFVPKALKVRNVRLAEGDLLEWQETCKSLPAGTVVWHPGGSMSSHYAVHCYNNNIPILTTHEPKIGMALKATTTVRLGKWNDKAFLEGVKYAVFASEADTTSALNGALAIFHNSTVFDRTNVVHMRMLGCAAGWLIRLGFLASYGEARHYKYADHKQMPTNRSKIYMDYWGRFDHLREHAVDVWEIFCDYKNWDGAFGGPRWAKCQHSTMVLWNLICFLKNRNKECRSTIPKVLDQMNVVINMVHNGGKYLNKFNGRFETAANNASQYAIEQTHLLYQLYKQLADEDVIDKTTSRALSALDIPDELYNCFKQDGLPYRKLPNFIEAGYKSMESSLEPIHAIGGEDDDYDDPNDKCDDEDCKDCYPDGSSNNNHPKLKLVETPTKILHAQYDFDDHGTTLHIQYVTDADCKLQTYKKHLLPVDQIIQSALQVLQNPVTEERYYSLANTERVYTPLTIEGGYKAGIIDEEGYVWTLFDFRNLWPTLIDGEGSKDDGASKESVEKLAEEPKPKTSKAKSQIKGKKISQIKIDDLFKMYDEMSANKASYSEQYEQKEEKGH